MDFTDKMSMMDEIYSRYMMDRDEIVFCKDAEKFFNSVMSNDKKMLTVTIVNCSKDVKEPFFGMRIFPAADEVDAICQDILDDKLAPIGRIIDRWKHISNWELEIDSRVFDRMVINFNPQELTAMTLHEIGHIIYSETKPEQFYRAYRSCRLQMSTTNLAGAKVMYFLYQIPLYIACGLKDWQITSRDMNEELFADSSVKKLGYGEHLVSSYEKIIKTYGNAIANRDEHAQDAEIEQSITWCNLNVSDLVHRKNKLKDELYYTGSKTNSPYIRRLFRNIMKKLGLVTKNRYNGNIVLESSAIIFDDATEFVTQNELIYDIKLFGKLQNRMNSAMESATLQIAQEAFGKNKKDQLKPPTQLDIDTIFVEVDRMQNHADRRYVLDLIYDQEEKIERFKEQFKYNPSLENKYADKFEGYLRDLSSMRKAVLAKRSFDQQYKVFVKYPVGYEG